MQGADLPVRHSSEEVGREGEVERRVQLIVGDVGHRFLHRLDGLSQQQHLLTAQLLAALCRPGAQPAQEPMGFR